MSVPRHWLARFVDEAFTRGPSGLPRAVRSDARRRARRDARASFFHRGLAFGAPLLRKSQALAKDVDEIKVLVAWLAVVADHVDLVGHHLDEHDLSPTQRLARRAQALSVALAAVYGDDDDVAALAGLAGAARIERAQLAVERELLRRRYLRGNPLIGLTLNHALSALDAGALVDVAVEVYGAPPQKGVSERVRKALAAERLAVVAAIASLSSHREETEAELVRSASIWQAKNLGLDKGETVRVVEVVKRPPDVSRLVTIVPERSRERVLMHTLVAAWVDGRLQHEERLFVRSLSDALGVPQKKRARLERRVSEFVRRHREELNPLAHAAGFEAAGTPMPVRFARAIFENVDHLWEEIRETGDLAVLLARRASGQKLDEKETRRMKEQLADVAKAVPSLAIFTLPGGFVLLPILLKLLPFDLRPSSFRPLERFHAFQDEDAS